MSFLNPKEKKIANLMRVYVPQVSSIAVDTHILPKERAESMDHSVLVLGILSYISMGAGVPHKTVIDSIIIILDDLKRLGATNTECRESIDAIADYISACTDDFKRHFPTNPFESATKTYISFFSDIYPDSAIRMISFILRQFSDGVSRI